MTTENQDLEQAAKTQFVQQRTEELTAYIDQLFVELELAWDTHNRSRFMSSGTLLVFLLVTMAEAAYPSGWASINHFVATLLFWSVLGREWLWVIPRFLGGKDELRGVFKTLEILGMLEKKGDGEKRIKKYKESFIAKAWAALKQKARETSYQAA